MSRLRTAFSIATVLAGTTVAHAGFADAHSGPLPVPTLAVQVETVPDAVQAEIGALKQACAAWPFSERARSPDHLVPVGPPHTVPAERDVCDFVVDPTSITHQLLWIGGIVGALAMIFGLLAFSFLRSALVSLWNWTFPRAPRDDWSIPPHPSKLG